jgi:hypothetical protein
MSAQSKTQVKKPINRNRYTQPTQLSEFNVNKIIFDEPIKGSIPNTPITFHRVNLGYRNPDGTEGELVLELPDCPTFGVSENTDTKSGELQGYSVGITFGDYKQVATEEQTKAVEAFTSIVDVCKKHLLKPEVYENCGLEELYETDLRKMAPHAQKKDKDTKKVIPDSHYSIYPKLMWDKERQIEDKKGEKVTMPSKFRTELWDNNDADNGIKTLLNPLECVGKRGRIRAFVKIEGIFVGEKIKVQLKLYAAGLTLETQEGNSGYKSLFRFNSPSQLETKIISSVEEEEEVKKEDEEETFTVPTTIVKDDIKFSDNEEEEEEVKPKKPVKGKGKK